MGRRVIGKLTALEAALLVKKGERKVTGDGGGLYLQVGRNRACWVFRYRSGGRLREMGLGPFHTVGLAEARRRAAAQRLLRLDGKDPIETRRAARQAARVEAAKAMTFKQCAERYIAAHKTGWRSPKSLKAWEGTLAADVYPIFGALPIQAIDTDLVMKAVEPIWTTKPETASRVRGRIESILAWAAARGFRKGENPALWRGHLENLLPKKTDVRRVEHLAALPYPEIGGFIAELRQREGLAARALEFVILTAARTGDVIGARWDEIDLGSALWTIPAARTKGGCEHRVPLSEPAVALLRRLNATRDGDFVFPGGRRGKPLSSMALLMTLRRMGRGGELTSHGFRSTFRDWVAERTNFSNELGEMALAHAVGDKVEAACRRGDLFNKRRRLMDAWARFCTAASAGGSVTLLRPAVGGAGP